MERNTFHLYEALGIPKSSTQDEIKKAYRRLALRYHPDKVNVAEVPDHENKFREIAAAYEVLGDPKKRQVYDKYGLMGVQMAGTDIGAMLMEVESLLCTLFMFLSSLLALVIVFLAFLSLRVDGKINWNYYIVFIPLWIQNAIMLFTALYLLVRSFKTLDRDDDDDEQNHEEENAEQRDRRIRETKRRRKCQSITRSVFGLINIMLIIAFEVLIVIKANDPFKITAVQMFAPYFALEGIFFFLAILEVLLAIKAAGAAEGSTLTTKLGLAFEALWWKCVRLALAILIMLRMDGNISCSWGMVFIPLYVASLKYVVQLALGYWVFSKMTNLELKKQGQSLMVIATVIFSMVAVLLYSLIGLLAAKLDGHPYATSTVLIPVFIVLSMSLCCTGCCLPCLLFISSVGGGEDGGTDEDLGGQEGPRVRLVSPNLRIQGHNDSSSVIGSRV
ncbi:hypothetical protein EDD11_005793 [Mortierella claussenii]|nr:hypothetical protein EDD11_005793 [Mortierella claussenii]